MSATDKLIAGHQRFRTGYYQENREKLLKLAELGQSPKIALVSCSDSRVEPSIILGCEPGDLFIIRNVANLVPPKEDCDSFHGTSAALEFAVEHLQVESIVVLGHTQCGGIKALMDTHSSQKETFISKWMNQLIQKSLQNLQTFPCIQKRIAEGSLKLHGWYYDLNTADLFALQDDQEFHKIDFNHCLPFVIGFKSLFFFFLLCNHSNI